MLVDTAGQAAQRVFWRWVLWGSITIAALAMLSLSPYLTTSTDVVKMRNALLLTNPGGTGDFEWTPANIPPDFALERGPIDPFFVKISESLDLAALPDDWTRAKAISRHLLGSHHTLKGGAIQSDLRGTYLRIIEDGDGYCADFVRTFMAIAIANGMHVRAWAFSFDGFGGHGHIWPEIWNRQLGRWQLVGVYNNYYFYEKPDVPLSALELRHAMLSGSTELKMGALDPSSRIGWKIEGKAWDYYRRGLDEWYMWWGNNVFTYDRASMVKMFIGLSRSMEQFAGIIHGISPRLRILATPENQPQREAIVRLRLHLRIVAVVMTVAISAIVLSLLHGLRMRFGNWRSR